MQIFLDQPELTEAVIAYVSQQIALQEGQELSADFQATDDGTTIAVIHVQKAGTGLPDRFKGTETSATPAKRTRRSSKAQEQASEPERKAPLVEEQAASLRAEEAAATAEKQASPTFMTDQGAANAAAGEADRTEDQTQADESPAEVAVSEPVAETPAAPVTPASGLFGSATSSAPPTVGAKSLFANLPKPNSGG